MMTSQCLNLKRMKPILFFSALALCLVLAGCCTRITRIQSTTASTLPSSKTGRYIVSCSSNAAICYVLVDGVRVPMRQIDGDLWEAVVELEDRSVVWFEGIVPSQKQVIRLVSQKVL